MSEYPIVRRVNIGGQEYVNGLPVEPNQIQKAFGFDKIPLSEDQEQEMIRDLAKPPPTKEEIDRAWAAIDRSDS